MNLSMHKNSAWKNIFNDNGECQKALSRLVRDYIIDTINQCRKYGAIDKEENQRICDTFQTSEINDYAETVKLVNTKISTIYFPHTIFISQVLRQIKRDSRENIEIKKLFLEYQEFENIPRQISYYRHAWAHNRDISSSGAWTQLLVGLLTRLCEIVGNDKNTEDCDLIHDVAVSMLKLDNTINVDTHSTKGPQVVEIKQDVVKLILQMLENINLRLDRFGGALEAKNITVGSQTTNTKDLGDEHPGKNEESEDDLTPEELLAQQLKKIRNQIEFENEFNLHYPGPAANILQGPIIDDILKNRPQNIDEFKRLPNFVWAWKHHEKSMEIQLRDGWERIDSLLVKFE